MKESFTFLFPSIPLQLLQIFYWIISGMSLRVQENKGMLQSREAWTWKRLRKQTFCGFPQHWLVVSQWDNYNNEVGKRKMVQLYLISSNGCWLFNPHLWILLAGRCIFVVICIKQVFCSLVYFVCIPCLFSFFLASTARVID